MENKDAEKHKGLTPSKTLDELLKGGLKKGEFVHLYPHTGQGFSYLDIPQPNHEQNQIGDRQ